MLIAAADPDMQSAACLPPAKLLECPALDLARLDNVMVTDMLVPKLADWLTEYWPTELYD